MRYDDEVHRDIVFVAPDRLDAVNHLVASPSGLGSCSLHEYRRDVAFKEDTIPTPRGDAVMAVLMLRQAPRHRFWVNGRETVIDDATPGQIRLFDLRDSFSDELSFGFHTVHLFMPNKAFAQKRHTSPSWNWALDQFNDDDVLFHLIHSLMPSLTHPQRRDQLFCDLVLHAVSQHIAKQYADLIIDASNALGTLSPRYEQRAKDLLMSRIGGDVALADVAAACGLSESHFARVFKRTTGLSPYRWLTTQRIEKAKIALQTSNDSLVEIALACGFANQSHFTRVFSSIVQASPGQWRREMRF